MTKEIELSPEFIAHVKDVINSLYEGDGKTFDDFLAWDAEKNDGVKDEKGLIQDILDSGYENVEEEFNNLETILELGIMTFMGDFLFI